MHHQDAATSVAANAHGPYRADIDGLRAIAVVGVLLYHAFPTLLPGGFVGVDVFFVISGFLITRVILDGLDQSRFSIGDFYARRVRRIFPALLLVLAACFAFGWKTMLAEDLAHLGKQTAGGAGFIANLVLWSEAGYFDIASASKPLLHLWSLGIEEQFYLAWPLLLWAAWRMRLPLMPVIIATAVASFLVNLHYQNGNPTAAFYSPLSRAWELMIGGMLAHWSSAQGARERTWWAARLSRSGVAMPAETAARVRACAAWVGVALLVIAMLSIRSTMPFPGVRALLPTLGTALLIGAGPSTPVARWILSSRPFVWIGLISYPLYLWHWPLLTLARNAYGDLSTLDRAGLLLAGVVLAWLTWRLVERPLRSSRRGGLKVAAQLVGMAIIGVLGYKTWKNAGYPSRYPEIIQRATEYDLEAYRAGLRNHICFMEMGENADKYAPECVDQGTQPLWVLWGDSSAASLYTGIRGLQQRSGKMRLAQFTSSACPPMAGFAGPNPACTYNNDWALASIARLKPDTVLMAAMWHEYDKANLPATLARLKALGVRRVVMLGPPPSWKDTPSRIVFNLWRDDPLHATPPPRLDYTKYGMGQDAAAGGADYRTATAEVLLRDLARQTGVEYISLTEVLCNEDGCLTRSDSKSGETFYLDIVHLTPAGSRFTADLIAKQLLQDSP
jgi:peptidoglycan/LPS O-acetylase OafA/YrhL